MAAAGQTINDRILAARHSIAGQGLAKAVCKATTEEIIGPKKKHLDYLLHCTNEPNVSIPTLANLLIERTQNPNWVVVFKGLITTHHLMCYGNERFTQYLASSNSNFQLSNYLDKSGVQGYDMSPFIRRYAKYLSEKSVSYRNVAFDFCKVKRGKDGGTLRTMSADKLLKTLPHLQQQIDALLEFDCTSQDLNNGVINACFMLLFRDLIRLFACYNDGIINLLEKYFDMNKKQARDALDIYKKFLIRMDRVADFLKVAENVGIDKGDIPDLAKAPSSLLEALEAHLANLEGRKPGSGGTTPTGTNRVNVAAAVSTLSTTSNSFGTAAAASNGGVIDERTAEKLLQEEAAAMEKFRSTASASNPFAAAPEPQTSEETPNILDLFGVPAPAAASAPAVVAAAAAQSPAAAAGSASGAAAVNGKASDDLLQLAGNPFANMLNAAGSGAPVQFPTATPASSSPFTQQPNPGLVSSPGFASENAFNNIFGQPPAGSNVTAGTNLFGEVLQPANSAVNSGSKPKVITGDLDSSLANLASNLNFGATNNGVPNPSRGPPMAGINHFQNQPMTNNADATSSSSTTLLQVAGGNASFDNHNLLWGSSAVNSPLDNSPSQLPIGGSLAIGGQSANLGSVFGAFPTTSSPFSLPVSQTFPSLTSSFGSPAPGMSSSNMASSSSMSSVGGGGNVVGMGNTGSPAIFPSHNLNTAFITPAFATNSINNNNNNSFGDVKLLQNSSGVGGSDMLSPMLTSGIVGGAGTGNGALLSNISGGGGGRPGSSSGVHDPFGGLL